MGATTSVPTSTPIESKPMLSKLIVLTRTGDAESFIDIVDNYFKRHKGDANTVAENLKTEFDFDIAKDVCRHGSYELYQYLKQNSSVDFNFGMHNVKVRWS